MGKGIWYTDEFKRDAAAQVKERGYSVKDVSERLGFAPSHCMTGLASFITMSQNLRARMRARSAD